jgi:hypothetical protein
VSDAEKAAAAQRLFAQYNDDAKKPHAGEHFKDFVRILLSRAASEGIFSDVKVIPL